MAVRNPNIALRNPNMTFFLLYGCNGQVSQLIHHDESIFLSFILLIMILIAIHGNLLVIVAIMKNKRLRHPRNMLLCSLAVVDLLSPSVRLLSIAIATIEGRWIFGCLWCAISAATGVFFCSASILHLCLITLERYICVRWPIRCKVWITMSKAIVSLLAVWLLALLMGLIPYFTSTVDLYFNNKILFCDFYLVHHPHLSLIMTSLYFCLPFFLMILVYHRIYRKTVVNNITMSAYHAGTRRHKNDVKRRMKQEWKTVKMCIVVIGVFFGLWLPYFSVTCIKSYHPSLLASWVERASLTVAYLNPCCNFVVYCIMNRKLRDAFRKLIPCLKTEHDNYVASFFTTLKRRTRRMWVKDGKRKTDGTISEATRKETDESVMSSGEAKTELSNGVQSGKIGFTEKSCRKSSYNELNKYHIDSKVGNLRELDEVFSNDGENYIVDSPYDGEVIPKSASDDEEVFSGVISDDEEATTDVTLTDKKPTSNDGDITLNDGGITSDDGEVTSNDGDITPSNDDEITSDDGDITSSNDGEITTNNSGITFSNDGEITSYNGGNSTILSSQYCTGSSLNGSKVDFSEC